MKNQKRPADIPFTGTTNLLQKTIDASDVNNDKSVNTFATDMWQYFRRYSQQIKVMISEHPDMAAEMGMKDPLEDTPIIVE